MRVFRAAIGVLGELLVTAGVIVLLFIAWQTGYSVMIEGRAQTEVVQQLEEQLGQGDTAVLPELPEAPLVDTPAPTLDDGSVMAIIRIPKLGKGWARPVYEGISLPVLAKGPGRYPHSAMPGQVGNMAIAGHRNTHGHPFFDIDQLGVGDPIVIETRSSYVVYRVARWVIVSPTESDVVAPVPQKPSAKPTEAWLTLTTCHPKFSPTQRYIVFAKLDRVVPRKAGPPPEVRALERFGPAEVASDGVEVAGVDALGVDVDDAVAAVPFRRAAREAA